MGVPRKFYSENLIYNNTILKQSAIFIIGSKRVSP